MGNSFSGTELITQPLLIEILQFIFQNSDSQPVGFKPFQNCILDIDIMIHSIQLHSNENNFMIGRSPQHEKLYKRVTALGRLRTTALESIDVCIS